VIKQITGHGKYCLYVRIAPFKGIMKEDVRKNEKKCKKNHVFLCEQSE